MTLVVTEGEQLRGSIGPFDVGTPWWQDMEPITALHPGLAILRLLDVEAPAGAIAGGSVRYLAEPVGDALSERPLDLGGVPSDLPLGDDPLRMPWAREGGPGRDLEWVASVVQIAGTPVQHRTWNLSAIWSVPTPDGEVWLKCLPPFLRHEGHVLESLRLQGVPEVLAQDEHRLLLGALPGRDGYDATREERIELIDALIAIQRTTESRTAELLDAGVPDRRWPALLEAARAVIDARAPHNRSLRELVDDRSDRVRAIAECGMEDVLVHTDAHCGNARVGPGPELPVWFDWGDSSIGHPVLDVAVLDRPGTPFRDELVAHWLDSWGRAHPGSDPHRAWRLMQPFAALLGAVVYQGFLDRIERSERVYHEGDVPSCLERAAQLALEPV